MRTATTFAATLLLVAGLFAFAAPARASDYTRIYVDLGDVYFEYGRPYYRHGGERLYVTHYYGKPRYYYYGKPRYYGHGHHYRGHGYGHRKHGYYGHGYGHHYHGHGHHRYGFSFGYRDHR